MSLGNLLFRKWRWDIIGVVGAALLLSLATTAPSAYFLHFDAPTQDYMAAIWMQNCWEHVTEKILPVLLLAPIFRVFGPAPHWETLLLMIATATSLATVYELTRLFNGTRLAGIIAALLLAALPAFQYFSRIHLGYPIPFLLLGWLMIWHKRWALAGACFGLAITAHYNSWAPVGLSLLAAMSFSRPPTWKNRLIFGTSFAAPLLAVDGLFFLYNGVAFEWNRSVFTEITRLSRLGDATPKPNWLWVGETVITSNGLILALVLATGIFAPLILFRRDKAGLAVSLTCVVLASLYTVQAGLGRAFLVSRVLASAYPFWAICSASVCANMLGRLRPVPLRRIGAGIVILGLAGAIAHTAIFIREFTETLYPQIEQAFIKAAEEKRPVRHEGNRWIPLFFAQIYEIELLTNDSRWIKADSPGQAVLIFEHESPGTLSRDNYRIESLEIGSTTDALYPGLMEEAGIPRRFEIWWPAGASSLIGNQINLPSYSAYYSGSGCVTPPPYGAGTLYFHQLVWQKITNWLGPQ